MDSTTATDERGSLHRSSYLTAQESHSSGSNHSESSQLGDMPAFVDPWLPQSQSRPSDRSSDGHHATIVESSYSSTAHSPSTSTPGTPTARRSSSSYRPIPVRVSSRFVEDLPEFQPYSSLLGTNSPHRRRFRSSPAVSFVLRRRSTATATATATPPRTPSRSLNGETPRHPNNEKHQKKQQKWKPMLLASACLSIAAIAIRSKQHSRPNDQPEMLQNRNTFSRQVSDNRFNQPLLARKPSKLKKRPPSTVPIPALQSRRGSTYNEWRRSMVVEISADVSRRSSQRSRKSTASRAQSSSGRTNRSNSTARRQLLRRGRSQSVFSRQCRRLFGLCGCRGQRI